VCKSPNVAADTREIIDALSDEEVLELLFAELTRCLPRRSRAR
jgi:hypothetical protein